MNKVEDGHAFKAYRDDDSCMICDEYKDKHIGEEKMNETKLTGNKGKDWDILDGLKQRIFEKLECTEEITYEFIKMIISDIQTFDKKQHDYGSKNISEFGEYGVLVQVWNKYARLKNLIKKGGDNPRYMFDPSKLTGEEVKEIYSQEKAGGVIRLSKDKLDALRQLDEESPQNESIEDSWKDLSIYSTIARLCRKGLWPV